MSLRAIIDTVIQVQSFRNIDLFEQGAYCVNFSLTSSSDKVTYSGSPYFIHSEEPATSSVRSKGPEIDETYYRTSCFVVKYSDDEVTLNEICVFRNEIELLPGYEAIDLTLTADLLFCSASELRKKHQEVDNVQFHSVCTSEIVIKSPIDGANTFCPITFNENYMCLVNIGLHALLVDFRFRTIPMLSSKEEISKSLMAASLSSNSTSPSLSEFLFGQKTELTDEDIDHVYISYISKLAATYERNRNLLEICVNKCIEQGNEATPMIPGLLEGIDMISQRIEVRDPTSVADYILNKLQVFSEKLYYLVIAMIEIFKREPLQISLSLQNNYTDLVHQRWGESILRNEIITDDFAKVLDTNSGVLHKEISQKIRKALKQAHFEVMSVQQKGFFPLPKYRPVLFIDISIKDKSVFSDISQWSPTLVSYINYPLFHSRGHLLILVHGFQGNSFDVRMIKSQITLIRPDLFLVCSQMNEGETDGSILVMGQRLALEVADNIEQYFPGDSLRKLSFIGHSLGGTIIRAALPHLIKYSGKMHMFLTFSSPHLGYMYNSSKMVNAGMWYLKKKKKNVSIRQLTMTDHKDPRKTLSLIHI